MSSARFVARVPTTAGEAASPFSALPHSLALRATRSLPPAHTSLLRALVLPQPRPVPRRSCHHPEGSSPRRDERHGLSSHRRRRRRRFLCSPAALPPLPTATRRHFSFPPRLLSPCGCLSLLPPPLRHLFRRTQRAAAAAAVAFSHASRDEEIKGRRACGRRRSLSAAARCVEARLVLSQA